MFGAITKDGIIVKKPYQPRWELMKQAARFFTKILSSDIKKICVENPIPHKYALEEIDEYLWGVYQSHYDKGDSVNYYPRSPKYDQIIQPWQFGHGETKATCLWLKGLPKLIPTNIVEGREQRVHRMAPGPNRSRDLARTYTGIAQAMAAQWGGLV